jgi:hypothetical protein
LKPHQWRLWLVCTVLLRIHGGTTIRDRDSTGWASPPQVENLDLAHYDSTENERGTGQCPEKRLSSAGWDQCPSCSQQPQKMQGQRGWIVTQETTNALFAWLISHQPAVLFSHNKPATSNQYSSLRTNQHQPPANRTGWKCEQSKLSINTEKGQISAMG